MIVGGFDSEAAENMELWMINMETSIVSGKALLQTLLYEKTHAET